MPALIVAFMTWLNVGLAAETAQSSRDDFLSAVAVLHSDNIVEAARQAPETLTLDMIHYIAWLHGLDLRVSIVNGGTQWS